MDQKILDLRFKTLIDNLQEGILVEDQERQILYINQKFCDIFNIAREPGSLIGSRCDILADIACINLKESQDFIKRIETILANRNIAIGDLLETVEGKYYERDYIPVMLNDIYLGHMWKYRDITDHKNIVKDLNNLNHFKDQIFSIISHDLKNPIYGLQQMLKLMMEKKLSQNTFIECIPELYANTETVTHMMDNLLCWAVANLNGHNLHLQKMNIKELVDNVFENLQSMACRKQISLVNNVPDTLTMEIDKNIINIIIRNVVSNGLKFTNKMGSIKVSAKPYKITIEDTGIGMSKDKLDYIFDVQNTMVGTEGEMGSGIGLKLCNDLIKKHNGKIEVGSVLNKGTIVNLILE